MMLLKASVSVVLAGAGQGFCVPYWKHKKIEIFNCCTLRSQGTGLIVLQEIVFLSLMNSPCSQCRPNSEMVVTLKGSHIEVYSGIEFPKHDFQFNYDTNCRIYVVIVHHSGLSYNMF